MHEAPVPTKDSVAGVVAQVKSLEFIHTLWSFDATKDVWVLIELPDRCRDERKGVGDFRGLERGAVPVVI